MGIGFILVDITMYGKIIRTSWQRAGDLFTDSFLFLWCIFVAGDMTFSSKDRR